MRMIWVCLQIGWPQSQWIIISRFQWWDAQFSDAPCTLGFCRSTYLRNSNEKMPPMQNKDNSVRNLGPTEFMSIISQIWWTVGMNKETVDGYSTRANAQFALLQLNSGSSDLCATEFPCAVHHTKADPNIPAYPVLEIPIGRLWNRASY